MDVLKGTAAVLLVTLRVFADVTIHSLILGLVAVIGHMFPIFANFRGGKAVATSAGVLLGYSWPLFILLVASFYRNIKAHENCQPHIHDCGTRRINLFDNLLFCDRRLCIRDFSSLFIYLYHLSTPSKYFAH
ncbi:Glycerol-3-phosphate acyltransferase [Lysinibacillus sphaericus]